MNDEEFTTSPLYDHTHHGRVFVWQWGVSLVAMVTSRGVPSSFRLAGVQVAFAGSGVRVKGERVGALASKLERV